MHDTDPMGISGKVALVTGGASGIGAATALMLVGLGATVVIADRNAEALAQAQGPIGAVAAVQGDVTLADDAERMVGETIKAAGRLDFLIHAAGIGDDHMPVHEQDPERWRQVVDVNLLGSYLMCRAAGQVMVEQGAGAIVTISSIVGLDAFPGRSAYGVAKAGVIHLTKTLACEWGTSGVRVNCIAPAYTRTPMVKSLLERKVFDPSVIERRTPLGRFAEPDEMARAIIFLLSPWASYITGTTLPVDGGWSAYGAAGDVIKTPPVS